MAIKHNVYFDGRAQSLGFSDWLGHDATVGVLEPGEYDFGRATRQERITVLNGKLCYVPTGRIYTGECVFDPSANSLNPRNLPHTLVIEEGQSIKLSCRAEDGQVAYICRYTLGR